MLTGEGIGTEVAESVVATGARFAITSPWVGAGIAIAGAEVLTGVSESAATSGVWVGTTSPWVVMATARTGTAVLIGVGTVSGSAPSCEQAVSETQSNIPRNRAEWQVRRRSNF